MFWVLCEGYTKKDAHDKSKQPINIFPFRNLSISNIIACDKIFTITVNQLSSRTVNICIFLHAADTRTLFLTSLYRLQEYGQELSDDLYYCTQLVNIIKSNATLSNYIHPRPKKKKWNEELHFCN